MAVVAGLLPTGQPSFISFRGLQPSSSPGDGDTVQGRATGGSICAFVENRGDGFPTILFTIFMDLKIMYVVTVVKGTSMNKTTHNVLVTIT